MAFMILRPAACCTLIPEYEAACCTYLQCTEAGCLLHSLSDAMDAHVRGEGLQAHTACVHAACGQAGKQFKLGTPVWGKLFGFCAWPGIVWSLEYCRKMEAPEVIATFVPGALWATHT